MGGVLDILVTTYSTIIPVLYMLYN